MRCHHVLVYLYRIRSIPHRTEAHPISGGINFFCWSVDIEGSPPQIRAKRHDANIINLVGLGYSVVSTATDVGVCAYFGMLSEFRSMMNVLTDHCI